MAEERILLDKLYNAIANCDDEESIEVTKEAIEKDVDPVRLIDTALKAIEKVGDDFEKELIFLPELMLAGYGTEKVMSMIQKKMMDEGLVPETRGKLVMATVEGDLHNIGKDLVITMWRAKGFQVYDLGINVAASRIISVAEDFNADIVGISALMTTTLMEQKSVIERFEMKGIRDQYKIIVGGGVCTQDWADEIGADGYAEDAARAVSLVEKLLNR